MSSPGVSQTLVFHHSAGDRNVRQLAEALHHLAVDAAAAAVSCQLVGSRVALLGAQGATKIASANM